MSNKSLEQFTKLYPVSKTLRFELVPVGKTKENIINNGILDKDKKLAEDYKLMKKTIDQYHKSFIDRCLENASLNGLEDFYALYCASSEDKKASTFKKNYDSVKENLRKQIVKYFKNDSKFVSLDKKELIQVELENWIKANDSDLFYSDEFRNFTTYFTGYNTNRMNMYSDEEKPTAVAYRLINENLPKFIDNASSFEKIKASDVAENFKDIMRDMEMCINYLTLDEMFSLSNYSDFLTQPQIDSYNTIIGGRTDGDKKYKGLNEYINLYNQTHPVNRLPKLKVLYKQILSDRMTLSWLPEQFETADELCNALVGFYEEKLAEGNICKDIKAICKQIPQLDIGSIYVRNDASISNISVSVFGNYSVIKDAMEYYYEQVECPEFAKLMESAKSESARKKIEAGKTDFVSNPDFLSIKTIKRALNVYVPTLDKEQYKDVVEAFSSKPIEEYFVNEVDENAIESAFKTIADCVNASHDSEYSFSQAEKDGIKVFLDAILNQLHVAKPLFLPSSSELKKDDVFYGTFTPLYENLSDVIQLYNMVRNYLTKKPYSTEKYKLNFGNVQFLKGWVASKEKDYMSLIFRDSDYYYLGVMTPENKKVFDSLPSPTDASDKLEKMFYFQAADPSKDVQNLMVINGKTEKKNGRKEKDGQFAGQNIILEELKNEYLPERINEIRKKRSFSVGSENFSKADLIDFIDYYKERTVEYFNQFEFNFKNSEDYRDFSEFTDHINSQAYQIHFEPISKAYINRLIDDGQLYFFKIYNKDFSKFSKGTPNLHTLYFKALFADENLRNPVYKLNGEAEMFFRKASVKKDDTVVHSANSPIAKKNPLLSGEESIFSYDITKDRRYTVDKFQLHIPITLNFNSNGTSRINDKVCEYLKNNRYVNVIGIDRGERHLLYISMVDREGNVVIDKNRKPIQYSLNSITGEYKDRDGKEVKFTTPYRDILDAREVDREKARENWSTIENIKELKSGYLSQVVHHIAKLMVEYNAIVVLEYLNSGFKNSRVKVEKQVYQNFEKALIEKLNYLVFKDYESTSCGGLYNALQLTDEFSGFKNPRKQSGFIFYVPAWNTSKIDPVTGFVDLLKPKYKNISDSKLFFSKFDEIKYNKEKDWFEFSFDYSNFTEKAEGTRTDWTLCSYGDLRYSYNKSLNNNRGGYEKINVTDSLKRIFSKYDIDYLENDNLIEAICSQNTSDFFFRLTKALQILLAMRYSCKEDGKDFILSPVADSNGVFFNSDEVASTGKILPQDADANGAYNIARKGLFVLNQIDKAETYKDWSTAISNRDWLEFVQYK